MEENELLLDELLILGDESLFFNENSSNTETN